MPAATYAKTPAKTESLYGHGARGHRAWRPGPLAPRPRLKLGAARDNAEAQADRIALRALQAPAPARAIAPSPPAQGRQAVRRALAGSDDSRLIGAAEDEQLLPEVLEREITALEAGGQPLPPPLRADMEARLGIDLGAVRLHTDDRAARLNDTLHAHAFALGEHVAFAEGRFQPDTGAGRFLLAHELAHVAQQRGEAGGLEQRPVRRGFWGDLYDSAVGALGDIADWAVDQIRDFGWRLLETISPEFARTVRAIIDEGILSWLGRQVARAWDAYLATLRALVPFEGPRQLIDLFAGLVERAAAIAVALASGNCEPLMAAMGELRSFVTETVGVAWDRLTEFLRPIGEFFTGLWNDFGAPALQWLQEFGGAVWEGIQELGSRFWEWIRPVREAASRVWDWFSELLFGAGEADASGASEGGVVGWISRKAGEAWDWVKEQTRPVWQPVAEFAGQVAELIPPAFVRQMGERAQQLGSQLEAAGDGMNGGDGVADNRDTLAAVLPSVDGIIASVRGIIVGAGAWLGEKIGALAGAVTGLIGRLNASALLSWLGGALGWLAEAVNTLSTWARDQVAGLFALLVRAFDALTPFLQLVLETVRKVIDIYADLLQLPLLILNSIWQRVPACIREPIENFLQTQILARIPVFGQFFSDPEWWPRMRATALRLLRRIFVDGDLLGVAWEFFQAVLRLMGLPPELVVQVLAKAATALGDILTNPIGFLINLLRAMGAGFMNFFGNIATHLLNGVTGWLFGAVREAGVEPPADFSLGSVLKFVLDVLGLSVENVFERLKLKLDPAIVERLKDTLEVATGVWSFVSVLMTEGVGGLWRVLSEKLSGLWTTVLQGVMSFISTRVIAWASLWLVSFLDWSGITPTINTLIAIYRAIEAALDYLREMLEIVSRVLDGVVAIARGSIDGAAAFLEDALARSLPVAIGFLAYQAGLGRLSQRLREILGGLRERVNAAIDWMIDQALRLGRAVIDLVKRGAATVQRGVARLTDWWRARAGFHAADGEEHSIYIEGQGSSAHLMIASRTPTSFERFLDTELAKAKDAGDATRQEQIGKAIPLAAKLGEAMRAATQEDAVKGGRAAPAAASGAAVDHAPIISDLLERLATATKPFMPAASELEPATAPEYGPLHNGTFGKRVEVKRLNRLHQRGSEPGGRADPKGLWDKLRLRYDGGSTLYVRGHLLNDNLGGPGDDWRNLTPLTQDANNRSGNSMLHKFETPVKDAVEAGVTVNFVVTANYDRAAQPAAKLAELRQNGFTVQADIAEAEADVPLSVTCQASVLDGADKPEAKKIPTAAVAVDNKIDVSAPEKYQLGPGIAAIDGPAVRKAVAADAATALKANHALTWPQFRDGDGDRKSTLAKLEIAAPDEHAALIEDFEALRLSHRVDDERSRIAGFASEQEQLRGWGAFMAENPTFYRDLAGNDLGREKTLEDQFERVLDTRVEGLAQRLGALSEPLSWGAFKTQAKLGRLDEARLSKVKAAFEAALADFLGTRASRLATPINWGDFEYKNLVDTLPDAQLIRVRAAFNQRMTVLIETEIQSVPKGAQWAQFKYRDQVNKLDPDAKTRLKQRFKDQTGNPAGASPG